MYTQQANTGIAPLDAVLATAAMVTPDGGNTVAAQVAQAAAQKMRPQGIMGGMPQATQDFRTAAQIDNMKRMQMQQAMEQMAAQMTARPAGIEGLPAQNMQTFEAAQGGVVGYAGKDESLVKNQVEEILRKAPMSRTPEENAILRASGIDLTQRPMGDASGIMALDKFLRSPFLREAFTGGAHKLTSDELKRRGDAGAVTEKIFRMLGGAKSSPEPQLTATTTGAVAELPQASYDHESRVGLASKPISGGEASRSDAAAPAPRPPAPATRPPAAAPAPTGIAAALAERPQYDVASIPAAGVPYMKAGEEDVARLRKAEGERAAFEKTLPDLSAKGIEALQQRMRDVEAAEAARKESAGLDRVIQQLLGRAQGPGGAARADIQFMNAQRAAADAFSQARLGNQQAQLLLEKAQQERQLGRFDRAIALEKEASALMEKARDNALKAQDIRQRSAGTQFQGAVQMYEGSQNREANRKLAEYNRQTQLMKPHEIQMIEGLKKDKLDQLTGGKPETATAEQRVEATEFALQTVKGAPRAGSIDAKNNVEALRQLGQWEKDVGANIKAMNAKNPQVYEDARRAKIQEINVTLGATIPLGGRAGEEPPPNIKAILNKYGS